MELQPIQSKIYEIRGQRVMLDFDLAELYQVETRVLKQAVRRNIERFPEDFMLRLSAKEANRLIDIGRSQNVIPQGYNIGSSEMFAFTEEGVAMLSGVLRSKGKYRHYAGFRGNAQLHHNHNDGNGRTVRNTGTACATGADGQG